MYVKLTASLSFVVLGLIALPALSDTPELKAALVPALPDGRHDFDFEVGTWKAHVRTLHHRLSAANDWEDYDGTVVTRALPMLEGWNESEMRVENALTHKRIELLAVRLYNPNSRQWSIYGSSLKTGVFDPPPWSGSSATGTASSTARTIGRAVPSPCAIPGRRSATTRHTSSRPSLRTAARHGK